MKQIAFSEIEGTIALLSLPFWKPQQPNAGLAHVAAAFTDAPFSATAFDVNSVWSDVKDIAE